MNQWSCNSTPPYTLIYGTGINLPFYTLTCEEILWAEGRGTLDIGNKGMCTFIGWLQKNNTAVIK
jgi:hypothetical protein